MSKVYKITIIAESILDKNTLQEVLGKKIQKFRGKPFNDDSILYLSIEEAEKIE